MLLKKGILFFVLFVISHIAKSQHQVDTFVGDGLSGFVNGSGASVKFNLPFGICIDGSGNLFVADGGNNCIRKITRAGEVTTYAGSGTAGYADGIAATAQFSGPSDLCVDDSGNVYVSDFSNQRIRKISTAGMVTTIAGDGTAGYLDGPASTAEFCFPRGICTDSQGTLYVSDSWNHRIRMIDAAGNVSTYAGGGTSAGLSSVGSYVDASDTSARFYTPAGICMDANKNIFVADAYNHRIRKIDPFGNVTTVCGSGATGIGNGGYADGSATTSIFNTPTEVFADSLDNLFIGDTFNSRVRKVDASGNVTTLAGSGVAGFLNGPADTARFNYSRGVVSNKAGDSIFVVDYNNHCVRVITPFFTGIPYVNEVQHSITVFPNPASGICTVSLLLTGAQPVSMVLYNEVGEVVFQKSYVNALQALHADIDISRFSSGIYFLSVSVDEDTILRTLVVSNF